MDALERQPKEGMLEGSGPQGLTQQEVERIMALVK